MVTAKMGFCFDHVTTDMHSERAPQRLGRLSFWIFPHLAFSLLCPFLECVEELQEPAKQTEVKLRNLGWLRLYCSTGSWEVRRCSRKRSGLGGRLRFSSLLCDFWQVTEGSKEFFFFCHAEPPAQHYGQPFFMFSHGTSPCPTLFWRNSSS